MKQTFLFLFIAFIFSCQSVPKQTARLAYGSNKFAIHKIVLDEEKKKKYLFFPKEFSHPLSISEQKIFNILSELVYTQKTNINSYKQEVFVKEDILELSKNLSQILQQVNKDDFLLVIMRSNPGQTVISQYQLTRFLVWNEDEVLNLFFDKIRTPIVCRECSLQPRYWALPRFGFQNRVFGKSFIESTDNIRYKVSGNLVNRKWITVDISKIQETSPIRFNEANLLEEETTQSLIDKDESIKEKEDESVNKEEIKEKKDESIEKEEIKEKKDESIEKEETKEKKDESINKEEIKEKKDESINKEEIKEKKDESIEKEETKEKKDESINKEEIKEKKDKSVKKDSSPDSNQTQTIIL